ncbi:hypothetical protein ACFRAO_34310 [Streptomyces sp. NPDC056656]
MAIEDVLFPGIDVQITAVQDLLARLDRHTLADQQELSVALAA